MGLTFIDSYVYPLIHMYRGKKLLFSFALLACFPLIVLIGCATQQQPYTIFPFMDETDLTKLTETQLVSRFQFTTTGCLRSVNNYIKAGNFRASERMQMECQKRRKDTASLSIRLLELHPEIAIAARENLLNGVPFGLGMTREQVKMTMGTPDDTNLTVVTGSSHEQWIYKVPEVYIYFTNGIVSGFQL